MYVFGNIKDTLDCTKLFGGAGQIIVLNKQKTSEVIWFFHNIKGNCFVRHHGKLYIILHFIFRNKDNLENEKKDVDEHQKHIRVFQTFSVNIKRQFGLQKMPPPTPPPKKKKFCKVNQKCARSLRQGFKVSEMEVKGESYRQDLASFGGAVDVLAGLVHSQRDAVQQDDHHAHSLKPREIKQLVKGNHKLLSGTDASMTTNTSGVPQGSAPGLLFFQQVRRFSC